LSISNCQLALTWAKQSTIDNWQSAIEAHPLTQVLNKKNEAAMMAASNRDLTDDG